VDRFASRPALSRKYQVSGHPLDPKAPDYLVELILGLEDGQVRAAVEDAAWQELEIVYHGAIEKGGDGEEAEELKQEWEQIKRSGRGGLDQLLEIIMRGRRKEQALSNMSQWITSAAGPEREASAILQTPGARSGNAARWYALSTGLLEALVYLACLPAGPRPGEPKRRSLEEFLGWLRNRYSVYIDAPPPGMESPETYRAAKENVQAFRSMLSDMGILVEYADAFNSQYIEPSALLARVREEAAPTGKVGPSESGAPGDSTESRGSVNA
jgi:hypothetical protein